MDVTPYLEIQPAPRAVFDRLEERRDRVRFQVREPGTDAGWRPVTWGHVADRIRSIALWLRDNGFSPGERAAIYAHNEVEWATTALAIQAAGGVMVPVYPASTADQLGYVVDHSDARFLFVGRGELAERAAALEGDCRVIPLGHIETIAGREDELTAMLDAIDLDRPGLMLYTSGSTGNPKGVPLTHRNVGANARDWLECNGPLLEEGAVDLLWLPMSHIFGFGELCLGNTLGFTSYMTAPHEALALMPEVRPTVFMSVPAYWEKLAARALAEDDPAARKRAFDVATGGRLRYCLSGGAGLKREVKEVFLEHGVLIIEGYGLTETSPSLTMNRPDDYRFDSVGKPLPTVEITLAGDGEIWARGPNVFSGYHKNPEATAEAFTEDGWFKTGDLGRFTEDGFLQIVGRKKEILVTAGGKNVPPANIEVRFAGNPLIDRVVVYGDGKKYLVAGVWPSTEGAALESAALREAVDAAVAAVNAGLARFETIKKVAIMGEPLTVENGMLTASLKLRRKKVYERFADRFEALYEPSAGGRA